MAEVEVKGLRELEASLKRLSEKVQHNIMVGATRAAASDIKKAAKANVPTHLGVLRDSINLVRRKGRTKRLISFAVSPRSDLIKKGLEKRGIPKITWVNPRNGFKHSNYDNYGGYIEFGTSKRHAHPYLRPAYENQGPEAIDKMKEYIAKRLPKEIEKARARGTLK